MSNENNNRIESIRIKYGDSYIIPTGDNYINEQKNKIQRLLDEATAKAQVIINNAESQARAIINKANTDAETVIQKSKTKASQDSEIVKKQAYDEGFRLGKKEGREQFTKDSLEALKALDIFTSKSCEIKQNIINSAARDIVELINTIAGKVCHQSFDEDVLYNITMDAISLLNDKECITLIVNPCLVDAVTEQIPNFRSEIQKIETIKVLEDNSLSADGVIVETPAYRNDGRVSEQIAEINQQMFKGADDGME